jgi:16S rRNA (uracil1498-N3)-methyltransferase
MTAEITLIAARRSNVHLDAQRMSNKILHWRRVLAAACEQSGHLFVPVLNEPRDLNELLTCATEVPLAFDLDGEPLSETIASQDYLLLIGPEGGWDDVERGLFKQHKLFCYSLGDHTLRAETAPAVALTLVKHLQKN